MHYGSRKIFRRRTYVRRRRRLVRFAGAVLGAPKPRGIATFARLTLHPVVGVLDVDFEVVVNAGARPTLAPAVGVADVDLVPVVGASQRPTLQPVVRSKRVRLDPKEVL